MQAFIQIVCILLSSGADMSQLQGRCGHGGDRPLPAAAVATGRGRANVPCYFTWQCPLHVDQVQQSVLYPFIRDRLKTLFKFSAMQKFLL